MAEGYRDDPLQELRDEIAALEDVERRLMWVVQRGYGAAPPARREVEPDDEDSRRAWLEEHRDALRDHVDALQAGIGDDPQLAKPVEVTREILAARLAALQKVRWQVFWAGVMLFAGGFFLQFTC